MGDDEMAGGGIAVLIRYLHVCTAYSASAI